MATVRRRRFARGLLMRAIVSVVAVAALGACGVTGAAPAETPLATIEPAPSAPTSVTATPSPTTPDDPRRAWTAEDFAAVAIQPAGYVWSPAIGVSGAMEVVASVDAVYLGNVEPPACLDARRAASLVLASDLAAGEAGAQPVVSLGRSTTDGPEPELVRARIFGDDAAAADFRAALAATLAACPASAYVPDVHHRETVGSVTVAETTIGDREATRVIWADRAVYLDGILQYSWPGAYREAYVYVDLNAVVWLEFDVRAGAPGPADVEAFADAATG